MLTFTCTNPVSFLLYLCLRWPTCLSCPSPTALLCESLYYTRHYWRRCRHRRYNLYPVHAGCFTKRDSWVSYSNRHTRCRQSEGRLWVGSKSRTDGKVCEGFHPPVQNSCSLLSRKAEPDKFGTGDVRHS